MGLFNSLFGKKDHEAGQEGDAYPWNLLASSQQLMEIRRASEVKPQIIFKHSTSCGISSMVLRIMEKSFQPEEAADLYFLDLHRYRDVSDAVAEEFGHRHESPQLLVIKEGTVVASASHGAITEMDLKEFV